MQQQIILAVIQFFLQMVFPCAGRDRKMKSDYPARLLSLCQTELFTNFFEINKGQNHSKKETLFKRL